MAEPVIDDLARFPAQPPSARPEPSGSEIRDYCSEREDQDFNVRLNFSVGEVSGKIFTDDGLDAA